MNGPSRPALKSMFLIIGFICALFSLSGAQEVYELDLREAASLALARSPRLKEALSRLEIARERSEELAAPARPQASLDTGVKVVRFPNGAPFQTEINGQTTEIRPLASGPFGQPIARLRAQQLIADGGRIAWQLKASRFREDAIAQAGLADWSALYLEIRYAFIRIAQLQQEAEIHQTMLSNVQQNVDVARKRFELGDVAKGDVIFAQVPYSRAQLEARECSQQLEQETENLKALLGLELDSGLILKGTSEIRNEKLDVETAVSAALANRPDLASLEYEIDAFKAAVVAAKKENMPRVFIAGELNPVGFRPSGWRSGGYEVGVFIQWSFLDGGLTKHSTRRAEAEKTSADHKLTQVRTKVQLEVREAIRKVILAHDRMELSKASLDMSEEAVRIARGQYEAGFAGILELRESEQQFHQARLEEVRAKANLQKALALLDWSVGKEPEVALEIPGE